jgi:hypothetical protein
VKQASLLEREGADRGELQQRGEYDPAVVGAAQRVEDVPGGWEASAQADRGEADRNSGNSEQKRRPAPGPSGWS